MFIQKTGWKRVAVIWKAPHTPASRHGTGVWMVASSRAAGGGVAGAEVRDKELRGSKEAAGDEGF